MYACTNSLAHTCMIDKAAYSDVIIYEPAIILTKLESTTSPVKERILGNKAIRELTGIEMGEKCRLIHAIRRIV